MKLAFLISAHTDPRQLHRLVDSLPASSDCYIHIDLKSDLTLFQQEVQSSRVHFISNRQDVVWGSLIEVKYQMELIRAALSSGINYDYLITISGLDYPVWSNEKIEAFFEKHQGKNILQGIRMTADDPMSRIYQEFRFLSHYRQKTLPCRIGILARKILKALGVKKPLDITISGKTYYLYKGAAWWAVTTELAAFVLHEWENNIPLVNYFKTSFGPAETFVQTVAFNSDFAPSCMLSTGLYKSLQALTPFTYIEYSPTIKILTEEDFSKVIESGKMFCRKTISGASDGFIAMIETNK